MSVSLILFLAFGIWLSILTIFVIWIYRFFRILSRDIENKNLNSLLRELAQKEEENTKAIAYFAKEIARFEEEGVTHTQKFGFVRFNPFNDMGGDHSFSVALLDGRNTGFVLTGLHTRERTRVYVKHIKRGKSEYDLSKEEIKAVTLALKD